MVGVMALLLFPFTAHATANYVYHTGDTSQIKTSGGATQSQCQYNYLDFSGTGAKTAIVRWKIQYVGYTTNSWVYYTTDGSTPSGSFGTGSGTTQVQGGSYFCSFSDDGGNTTQVVSATIGSFPPGTTVKYIIGAAFFCNGHFGSECGSEVFANSGSCNTSSCATVFSFTVTPVTVASYSRFSMRTVRGRTTLHWYSSMHVLGFNVIDGKIKLNRWLITSKTHWYAFTTHHSLAHRRIVAVWPNGHTG